MPSEAEILAGFEGIDMWNEIARTYSEILENYGELHALVHLKGVFETTSIQQGSSNRFKKRNVGSVAFEMALANVKQLFWILGKCSFSYTLTTRNSF